MKAERRGTLYIPSGIDRDDRFSLTGIGNSSPTVESEDGGCGCTDLSYWPPVTRTPTLSGLPRWMQQRTCLPRLCKPI